MYGLTTPANFSQPCSLSPPSPSGSRLLPPSAYQDPAYIPLPDLSDRDLLDPLVIAESHGYTPATKENTNLDSANRPQKHARAVEANEDDLRVKRGRPNSSNNYSTADIGALFDLVEDIVPLGQKGWQLIHSKFTQWAGCNGRPLHKAMSLKTKYKQVSLL
ncbi:hypothetical protein BDR03DRAFT_1015730 [Suillus americanus]|nr:hypothetical protein BDR03DRAFT_1015730 [Suillus americanus]